MEAQGFSINPADAAALARLKDMLKPEPQPTIQSTVAKNMAAKNAAKTNPTVAPKATSKAQLSSNPTGIAKDGRPYYKWSNGKNYFEPEPKK
jgi:hypothetical protein